MKQLFDPLRCFLLLAMLVAAGSAFAQARIGYVDMKRVLDKAPQVAAGRAALAEEFRTRSEELRAMENRLDQLKDRLYSLGGDQQQLQAEVNALRREVRDMREELTEDVNMRVNDELAKVEAVIHEAIQALGREQGYDLILSSPVEYASEQIDLTDEVLRRLEIMYTRPGNSSSP